MRRAFAQFIVVCFALALGACEDARTIPMPERANGELLLVKTGGYSVCSVRDSRAACKPSEAGARKLRDSLNADAVEAIIKIGEHGECSVLVAKETSVICEGASWNAARPLWDAMDAYLGDQLLLLDGPMNYWDARLLNQGSLKGCTNLVAHHVVLFGEPRLRDLARRTHARLLSMCPGFVPEALPPDSWLSG